jgi:hypothetical protein
MILRHALEQLRQTPPLTRDQLTAIARGVAAAEIPQAVPAYRAAALDQREQIVNAVARELAAIDPRFDHLWFSRACGVQP